MPKYRNWSVILLILIALLGWFVYNSQVQTSGFFSKFPFRLGLDLAGGTELIYRADTTQVTGGEENGAMNVLKDVIERRVNLFGVSEPVVQVQGAGTFTKENRLIIDLPGVTDINEAVKQIGLTPLLEFRLIPDDVKASTTEELYARSIPTGLTGRLLSRAQLEFTNQAGTEPVVGLEFNSEGSALFADITKANVGKVLGVFLDKAPKSLPRINGEITGGKAQISGSFTATEARELVRNLNYGALPVPIELIGTQTIGPSLGSTAVQAGIRAGLWGFAILTAFLILWYRLPGFISVVALAMYVIISLVAFKLFRVTLTAAGIAGFILSIGMAVDANILIFERMKEELRRGKNLYDAIHEGFHRAWLSIRDSNISSIITALVLFWLGTSSVRGFALTMGLGVLISMFTAITVSRTFLFALTKPKQQYGRFVTFLFGSGRGQSKPKANS
jgi:preprotein translocase subunit SecD